MPLFEYYCPDCKRRFEEIVTGDAPESATCPRCAKISATRIISRFAVGGQGDLRDTTVHGCHEYDGHDHDHSHGHGSDHDESV